MLLSSNSVNLATGGSNLDDGLDDDQGTEEVDIERLIDLLLFLQGVCI